MDIRQFNPKTIKTALKCCGRSELRFACNIADRIVDIVSKFDDVETLKEGFTAYRARKEFHSRYSDGEVDGRNYFFEPYTNEEMGAPSPDKVGLGRFNPPNSPALYLATTKEVVLTEVRVLRSEICTVATFKTAKSLKIATLLRHDEASIFDIANNERSEESLQKYLLTETAAFVSRRVPDNERDSHYRACNLIASAFKDRGFQGLIYRTSHWFTGWNDSERSELENKALASNILLFNPELAVAQRTELCRINWKRPVAESY